ncbi:MAG: SpoIIE family protein phosphatase, partial [Acidobacteriota bacterium]|nr:SpoIIE family protein phosphatase [Acidobacteriota bacterium]
MGSPANSSARLVLSTNGSSRVIPLESLPFTIGRGTDRNLRLPNPQISREHASIDRDADGYLIHDANSRHGTFLNGVKITTAHLRSQDAITLGSSGDVLLFEDDDEATTRTLIAQLTSASVSSENDLEKLSLFLKAAQSLSAIGAVKDVLRTMLEYTIRLTRAERGFVFLGESVDVFHLACGQDQDGRAIFEQPAISYSVLRDAAKSQLDFIISDTTDEIAQGRDSLMINDIRSVIVIPLRCESPARLLGLLYLDSHSGGRDFSRTGKDILNAIARQAATLIENLRLLEMERESALLRKELEIAASIQSQIIPRTLPEFPYAELIARTLPCTGVGGDFYDVIPTPTGFVAIVADVCGKGVPAALLASMVQGMFHGQVGISAGMKLSLVDVVQSLNAFICDRAPSEKYVTMAVLQYVHSDTGNAHIELVNGGHLSPLIVRADGTIETITDGDFPVGLLKFAKFHAIPLTLAMGDRIVLLS